MVLEGRRLRPDFTVPLAARTIVEVDGVKRTTYRTALDEDLLRQNLFVRHGYLVLRYTDDGRSGVQPLSPVR